MNEGLKPIEEVKETKPTLDFSKGGWNLIDIVDVEQAIKDKSLKYCWYTKDKTYFITRDKGERNAYKVSEYGEILLPERLLPKTVIDILNTLGLDKNLEAGNLIEASRKHEKDGKPHWFLNKKGTTIGVCIEEGGKPTTKYYPVNKKTYSI